MWICLTEVLFSLSLVIVRYPCTHTLVVYTNVHIYTLTFTYIQEAATTRLSAPPSLWPPSCWRISRPSRAPTFGRLVVSYTRCSLAACPLLGATTIKPSRRSLPLSTRSHKAFPKMQRSTKLSIYVSLSLSLYLCVFICLFASDECVLPGACRRAAARGPYRALGLRRARRLCRAQGTPFLHRYSSRALPLSLSLSIHLSLFPFFLFQSLYISPSLHLSISPSLCSSRGCVSHVGTGISWDSMEQQMPPKLEAYLPARGPDDKPLHAHDVCILRDHVEQISCPYRLPTMSLLTLRLPSTCATWARSRYDPVFFLVTFMSRS